MLCTCNTERWHSAAVWQVSAMLHRLSGELETMHGPCAMVMPNCSVQRTMPLFQSSSCQKLHTLLKCHLAAEMSPRVSWRYMLPKANTDWAAPVHDPCCAGKSKLASTFPLIMHATTQNKESTSPPDHLMVSHLPQLSTGQEHCHSGTCLSLRVLLVFGPAMRLSLCHAGLVFVFEPSVGLSSFTTKDPKSPNQQLSRATVCLPLASGGLQDVQLQSSALQAELS